MEKVLSILVPVYNTEKYIRRCLDSILLESVLDDIEVIIVSDGSKDDSINIVKNEYLKKYSKSIKLIEKENGGHGSTINKGIEVANGKYFRVLDSDDWFNPIAYKKYVKCLKNSNSDLIVTNYTQEHVYDSHEVTYVYKDLEENKVYNFDKFDLKKLNGEYFVMATSTYKTEVLRKLPVNLFEKTFYVDMQYNAQAILNVKTFEYYDLDIYRYYIGRADQSVNVNSMVKNKKHHEKVMKYLVEFYSKYSNTVSKVKKEYLKQMLYYMLYTHYTIFCTYDKNYEEAYNQIKEFDEYLKNTNIELYNKIGEMRKIDAHRKSKFAYVKRDRKITQKMFNVIYR